MKKELFLITGMFLVSTSFCYSEDLSSGSQIMIVDPKPRYFSNTRAWIHPKVVGDTRYRSWLGTFANQINVCRQSYQNRKLVKNVVCRFDVDKNGQILKVFLVQGANIKDVDKKILENLNSVETQNIPVPSFKSPKSIRAQLFEYPELTVEMVPQKN